MSKLSLAGAFVLTLIVGIGGGYYLSPTKIVTKIDTKVLHHVDKNTTTTKKPDGTIIVENHDKINDKTDSHTVTIKDYKKPDWMISGGYLLGKDGERTIIGSLQRRVIGNFYIGAYGTSDGRMGVGVTLIF